MVTLNLSEEEAKVLLKVLEYNVSELRMEIADTDRGFFRDDLKHQREVINHIQSVLADAATTPA